MNNLRAMKEMSEAITGRELVDKMARLVANLEKKHDEKIVRALLGDIGPGTYWAIKSGTASVEQIEKAVLALEQIQKQRFRQQLLGGAIPDGLGNLPDRGAVSYKTAPKREPGTKYRDFHGRAREERDVPVMESPPVKKPSYVEITGREAFGRRIKDAAYEAEQAARRKWNYREARGLRQED